MKKNVDFILVVRAYRKFQSLTEICEELETFYTKKCNWDTLTSTVEIGILTHVKSTNLRNSVL